jgi:hypothetical protein
LPAAYTAMQQTGKYIILLGLILLIVGAVLWLWGDKLNWIGRLPGDIRIKKENYSVYIPITTMILFSILLSLILWLIRKLS